MRLRRVCSIILFIAFTAVLFVSPNVCNAEGEKAESSDFVDLYLNPFEDRLRVKVYEGFGFIEQASSDRNWKLAMNAAALSLSIYEGDVEKVLRKLGYDFVYDECAAIDPNSGVPGGAIAYKLIIDEQGHRKNVFAYVIRGTKTDAEKLTDVWDGGRTMFSESTDTHMRLFKSLAQFVSNKTWEELKNEDNYVFLTGHSLGGAVANKMSVKSEIAELTGNDKNKVYTYTFEAPLTCDAYFWEHVDEKSNAFNFIDTDDWVTMMPPLHMFGARFGTDVPFETPELDEQIFQCLLPNAKEKSNRDVGDHHNMIGDFVYILQKGNLFDDDYKALDQNGGLSGESKQVVSRLSEVVAFSQNEETGLWVINSKELYSYDEQGRLAERRICSATGEVSESETYEYDRAGNLLQTVQTSHYAKGEEFADNIYVIYKRDNDGKTTKLSPADYTGIIEFNPRFSPFDISDDWSRRTRYDETGKISSIELLSDSNRICFSYDFEYSNNSQTVLIKPYMWLFYDGKNLKDDMLQGWYQQEYDDDGNLVLDRWEGRYSNYNQYEYEYDEQGRLISEVYKTCGATNEDGIYWYEFGGAPDVEPYFTEWYKYDEYGNIIEDSSYQVGADGVLYKYEYQYRGGRPVYCTGTVIGSGMVQQLDDRYWEYDETGNEVLYGTKYDYDDMSVGWEVESVYDDGRLRSETSYEWRGVPDELGVYQKNCENVTAFYYVYQDFIVKDESEAGNTSKQTQELLTEVERKVRNNEQEEWQVDTKESYRYDNDGRLLERCLASASGEVLEKEVIEYDQKGQRTKVVQTPYYYVPTGIENIDGFVTHTGTTTISIIYDTDGRATEYSTVVEDEIVAGYVVDIDYDDDGRGYDVRPFMYNTEAAKMSEYPWPCTSSHVKTDDNGRPVKWTHRTVSSMRVYGISQAEYDDVGRCVAKRYYEEREVGWEWDIPDMDLHKEQLYTYNEHGDLIYESSWSEEEGKTERSYTITYYPNGNKETVHTYDEDSESSETWCYDEDGKLVREYGCADTIYAWETEYFYGNGGRLEKETHAAWIADFDDNGNELRDYNEMSETNYYYR